MKRLKTTMMAKRASNKKAKADTMTTQANTQPKAQKVSFTEDDLLDVSRSSEQQLAMSVASVHERGFLDIHLADYF